MTNNQLTREQAEDTIEGLEELISRGLQSVYLDMALAGMRQLLAAMDSEPVAEVLSIRPGNDTSTIDRALPVGTQLYRHAQPAPDREQVRREHAEWSQTTFGNVGPVGPLKHLSKEALEAAAEPDDLSEWADMQFLLWDAQRRAGITDEQITLAMIEKLAVNKLREWPAPKDGEPRLHIKEQPATVVPEEATPDTIQARSGALIPRNGGWRKMDESECYLAVEVWNACRAAMLQSGNPPAHSGLRPEQSGNSPVIPDGYVMVPKEPTEAMMLHKSGCQHHAWDDPDCAMRQTRRLIWSHMLAAAPTGIPMNSNAWIPVSERMPPSRHEVLVGRWWGEEPRWCRKWATYIPGHPDAQQSGWLIPGASWVPTHWQELPAAPQEVKSES